MDRSHGLHRLSSPGPGQELDLAVLAAGLADAAAAGEVAALDAPWPYNIVRPNIPAGSVDAIMVHGFVNQAGRFEALSIAFPSGFAQAPFVLGSLAQWQFRPAAQNGQPVRVEVLLIIPEDQE